MGASPAPLLPRERAFWVGFAVIFTAFALHLWRWRFVCDDAFISLRYAANLVSSGELRFNPSPFPPVEGYTNFLWVFGLGGLAALGLPLLGTALFFNAVGAVAVLLATTLLARQWRDLHRGDTGHRWSDFAPASLLVVWPEFVVWGSGGLETSAAVGIGLWSALMVMRGSWIRGGFLAALAVLTRPDTALWLGAFVLVWLGGFYFALTRPLPGRMTAPSARSVALALLAFAVPVVAHLLWRHSYYGAWLPNTWAVKHHGALLRDTWGRAYLLTWVRHLHLWLLIPLAWGLRGRHLVLMLPLGAAAAYPWSVGGDFMAYSRFMLPATVLVAMLAGFVGAELFADQSLLRGRGPVVVGMSWMLMVVFFVSRIAERRAADRAHNHQDGKWESVQAMDHFARIRLAAGEAMRHLGGKIELVSVGAAGAMPYGSGLPTFDVYGLVDAGVVEQAKVRAGRGARPGHQLVASSAYVRKRGPDLMCHIGFAGEAKPPASEARRRAGPQARWYCVSVPELSSPQAPEGKWPASYYCCLTKLAPEELDGE